MASSDFSARPEANVISATSTRQESITSAAAVAAKLAINGFAVIDFDDEALTEKAQNIRRFLGEHLDWQAWLDGKASDMRCADIWKWNPDARQIAANAGVLALLQEIYGRKAFPFQTLNFLTGSQQSAHVDIVHFSARPVHYMCGVWLALEDVHADAGPLLYYPGSHKWPVLTPESLGLPLADSAAPYEHYAQIEAGWERQRSEHRAELVTFEARRGQALIWDANLMHGGSLHRDRTRTRLSQVTHYFFEECSYYTPLTGLVLQHVNNET